MLRYIVCTAALMGVIYVTQWLLTAGYQFGFVAGTAIGVAFCAIIVALAFAYDAAELRRAQRLQRSEKSARQP